MKDEIYSLSGLFIFALIGLGIFWIFGGEKEGTIDTSDCRSSYEVKDEIWNRFFNKYTCTYTKTEAGEIMSGTCQRAETTSFTNECTAEYYYYKKPFKYCSEDYPWLGSDGKCWSAYGTHGNGGQTYALPD